MIPFLFDVSIDGTISSSSFAHGESGIFKMVVADSLGVLSYTDAPAIPDLQAVTNAGSTTTNNIVANTFQANSEGTAAIAAVSPGSNISISAHEDAGSPGSYVADLFFGGGINRVLVQDNTDLGFYTNSTLAIYAKLFRDGRFQGADAVNPTEFVTLSQLSTTIGGTVVEVTDLTSPDDILSLTYLNTTYPTAAVGSTYLFSNIDGAAGNVATAIHYDSTNWAVRLDLIKAS